LNLKITILGVVAAAALLGAAIVAVPSTGDEVRRIVPSTTHNVN
jgi:hypothetical protein